MSFILKIIAEDQSLIPYRKSLRPIGKSVTGTILLQQIIYWDNKSGGKFFKFTEPCNNKMYRDGDSWTEELGFSKKEVATALAGFAFKLGKKNKDKFGDRYDAERDRSLVQYYTDSGRITWYVLNRHLLSKLLMVTYKASDDVSLTINTETTTETTTDTIIDTKEFEHVWNLYQRKGNKQTALRYWKKLSQKDKEAIKAKIPSYVNTTPELRFRKDFQGWINPSNRIWENQIVPSEQTSVEKEEDFSDYKL